MKNETVTIISVILALVMTIITASSNIILKKAFKKINPFVGVYLSVLISSIFLWIATFLLVPNRNLLSSQAVMIFIVIGCFAPTIVRTLTYFGIDKLGAGRAAPLRALTPFFAVIIAMIFLKESPHVTIFIAIFLIISGITLLSKKNNKDLSHPKPMHYLYPIGAAILAGLAANMRKYGLDLMPHPIYASAIAATSSLVVLTFYMFFKHRKELIDNLAHHPELKLIFLAALLTSVGEIVDLSALLYGKVSLVVPIFAATPLVIVILSRFFLKDQEVINNKVIFAAILIIFGLYFTIKSM